MSMILDAIKRSREEQRDKSAMPNLDSDHFTAPRPRRRPPGALLLVSAVVIGGLALVIVVLTNKQADSNAQSGAGALSSERVSVNAQASTGGVQVGELPIAKVNGAGPSVAAAQRSQAEGFVPHTAEANTAASTEPGALTGGSAAVAAAGARPIDANRPAPAVATEEQQSAGVDPAIAALYSGTASAPMAAGLAQRDISQVSGASSEDMTIGAGGTNAPNARLDVSEFGDTAAEDGEALTRLPPSEAQLAEELIDMESVLARAQRALGESSLLPHPTPLIENLSQQTKDKIPSLFYTVHQYDTAGSASIVINGQRAQAGERVQGFTVKEILSDSAILSWGGTDFRLRALNSWVNL